jgi:head-tail adaptor
MTFELNIANDLTLHRDGLMDVTLTRRAGGDPETEIPAIRRMIRLAEAGISNGKYTTQDVRIHFAVNQIGGDAPVPGDTLTDPDGNIWTILAVETATLQTRFACVCRNLAITEELTTLVTVQAATYSKGTYGEQVATWANVSGLVDVRARVQKIAADRELDQGRIVMQPTYKVYMQQQFEAGPQHRIITSTGQKLRVIGYSKPDDIGSLFEVDCEVDTSEV